MATAKRPAAKKAGRGNSAAKKTARGNTAATKRTAKKAAKTSAKKTGARASAGRTAAKKTARRSQRRDALTKLKSDHDAVKKLFNRYERTRDDMSDDEKAAMVKTICGELIVHTRIEEEIFYRALRDVADDDLADMLDEAQVEHAGAKELVAQLQGATPTVALYDAKVKVLGEQIKHHAGEEEEQMFRKARRARVDLVVLGEQLEARSAELKGELGLA